ncbi:MAG: hypothetical protein ACYDAY_08775 [Candidatus Dormibacteria bacterium]
MVRLTVEPLGDLWQDEGVSLLVALGNNPVSVMAGAAVHDVHPPLYHLLLSAWLHTFHNLVAARVLGAVMGTAAVVLAAALAGRLFGTPALALTGILGALSAWHAHYSIELRMYGLDSLLAIASLYALVVALQRSRRRDWTVYAVVTVLFAYTDYPGLVAIAAQALWVWLRRSQLEPEDRRLALRSHLAVTLLSLPVLASLLAALLHGAGSGARTDLLQVATLLADLLAGWAVPAGASLVAAAAVLLAALVGVLALRREPWAGLFLLHGLLPILALLGLALFTPVLVARALVFTLPSAWVLAGAGIALASPGGFRKVRSGAALGAALVGSLLVTLSAYGLFGLRDANDVRAPSEAVYAFISNCEAHGGRFINSRRVTGTALIARDLLAHGATTQREASDQANPDLDLRAGKLGNGALGNLVTSIALWLQRESGFDSAAIRETPDQLAAWYAERDSTWIVSMRPGQVDELLRPVDDLRARDMPHPQLSGPPVVTVEMVAVQQAMPKDYHLVTVRTIDGVDLVLFSRAPALPSQAATAPGLCA